jgi:hypothetical protein
LSAGGKIISVIVNFQNQMIAMPSPTPADRIPKDTPQVKDTTKQQHESAPMEGLRASGLLRKVMFRENRKLYHTTRFRFREHHST